MLVLLSFLVFISVSM